MSQIIEALLPINSDKTFAYKTCAQPCKRGQLLSLPFGNKTLIGVVIEETSNFASEQIKEVAYNHNYFLEDNFLKFLRKFANYNMLSFGQAFKMSINAFSSKTLKSNQTTASPPPFPILSLEQEDAFNTLVNHKDKPAVLEGVTGSGKTLVYLKLTEEILKDSGQILILLPEITLTAQIIERVKALLPHRSIFQWHSGLSTKKRQEIWQQCIQGMNLIIIGARSALFLPFTNLKLIIVDEEHDASFKQDQGAIYNARDMAVLRGKIENARVILTSATPSIETIYNIDHQKYYHIYLQNRFGGVLMPKIQLIDMKKEQLPRNQFLSGTLRSALSTQLEQKKQSLIFLNRKGYAPLVLCKKCGTKSKCPNCSSWLVFYKSSSKLVCHYCNYNAPTTSHCSNCLSNQMIFYGPGIEKIAEEVASFLPQARLVTATSDTLSSQKQIAALLEKIVNHEIDILIGTQIISKGLNFKLLQLVCVVDADCNYTTGDIRANERIYQLLSQVSGRSGRDKEQGLALMQTYDPDNYILNSIVQANQAHFIEAEMNGRKLSQMPPFSRLALINIGCKNESKLIEFVSSMSQVAPVSEAIRIIGPSTSPIYFLKKEFRYRFIIRADKKANLQKTIHDWLHSIKIPSYIQIKIDIDPYNFS